MQDITVHATQNFDLLGFLAGQGFEVEVLSDNVKYGDHAVEQLAECMGPSWSATKLYAYRDFAKEYDVRPDDLRAVLVESIYALNNQPMLVSIDPDGIKIKPGGIIRHSAKPKVDKDRDGVCGD